MRSNPYYTTYTTKRVPFIGSPEQRTGTSSSKDQLFINFFPEALKTLEGTKMFLEQRAGLVYQQSSGAVGVGRGMYYWFGSMFTVVGSTLYRNGVAIQALATSTGTVGFQECSNDTIRYLVVLDGISGWRITTSFAITQITDVDFPSPHVTQAAYLDGYLTVAKAGTPDLYNSDLSDPLGWTVGNFISAEAFPDAVVALVRQNNYVVAFGTQTIEYFYDAGNSPGTPFARNSAAFHQIGTSSPDSIAEIEEQVAFVGQSQSGGRTVWLMTGFNPSEIGNEQVRQSLDNEGASISNAKAYAIRSKGHKFYVLNLTNITWVYDFDMQMWHRWADSTGANKFPCDYASDSGTGSPTMMDRTNGMVYALTEGVSTDATGVSTTTPLTSIAISSKLDFGSMNNKFMHRLSLICDGVSSTSCSLSWSDDDYQTYYPARTIPISNTMPVLTQLGIFRRRAFKLVYADVYPLRLEGFEIDINAGTQ